MFTGTLTSIKFFDIFLKAGAEFGTGYCDAQCPHDIKFINGEANLVDWEPR